MCRVTSVTFVGCSELSSIGLNQSLRQSLMLLGLNESPGN